MDWEPLELVDSKAQGLCENAPGLQKVYLYLSRLPEREWQQIFEQSFLVSISASMHPPEVRGRKVVITPPKDDDEALEKYVEHVKERIEKANERYRHDVLREKRKREKAREERKKEEQQLNEKTNDKLDNLID
jgi:hypothetical protein